MTKHEKSLPFKNYLFFEERIVTKDILNWSNVTVKSFTLLQMTEPNWINNELISAE